MLQFMVSQRVGYNLAAEPQQQTLDGLGSGEERKDRHGRGKGPTLHLTLPHL